MSEETGEYNSAIDISILPERFLTLTNREVTAQAFEALDILSSGELPEHFLEQRQGPSGQKITYLKHTVATKILNRAFQYLWDFEVDHIQVGRDGSVAALCKMTIHIPIGKDVNGVPIFHTRVIQEVGSFEAYPMKTKKEVGVNPDNTVKYEEVVARDGDGNVVFTMNEADRCASAASRGLVKCCLRGFNLGIDLMEKSETAPMTYEAARRLLLDYALKKHLIQEEEAVALLKEAGFTRKTLVVEFGRAWKVLKEAGEARVPGL